MTDTQPRPDNPRWQRRPAERRREILDAAVFAFGQLGFERATLADVARKAGVSAGTVAHYFGTKQALFEAVIADRFVEGVADEEALLASHRGSYLDLLAGLLERMFDRMMRPGTPELMLVCSANARNCPEANRLMSAQLADRWHRLFRGVIEAGVRSGELRSVDPDATARVLGNGVAGIALGICRCPGDRELPTPGALLAQYLELVRHGLAAEA